MTPADPDAEAALEAWIERAFAALEAAGGDPLCLAEPHRTLIVITACQGVIDNGGLRYFFENDWPGQPPYSTLADTYRSIGAPGMARAIEAAAALFPFPRPESDQERRRATLAGPIGTEIDALTPWDEEVWSKLARHVKAESGSHLAAGPDRGDQGTP